ncbi:hypothetical protein RBI22_00955 [Alcaligenaceae bacterium C4P045]|nr:hypothetical protein [Alcaligenaceae bacterium C4P045]
MARRSIDMNIGRCECWCSCRPQRWVLVGLSVSLSVSLSLSLSASLSMQVQVQVLMQVSMQVSVQMSAAAVGVGSSHPANTTQDRQAFLMM